MSRLRIEHLTKNFGGIMAVQAVSLAVQASERRAIIGPNGAGKSTLFHLISGDLSPTRGHIFLDDQEITQLAVHQRANLGLSQTFQRNNLFNGLTVFENMALAVQHQQRLTRHFFKSVRSFSQVTQKIEVLLTRVGLLAQRDQPVRTLAYGQQRALEVGLALATQPRLLLLDEPTAGMSPAETVEMTRLIAALPRSLTILIVEHDMDVIFALADQITVLHYGQVISEGAPAEVRADPLVREIYLGVGH
jgi:branched-chain amino acid transport system ATP-binding protein